MPKKIQRKIQVKKVAIGPGPPGGPSALPSEKSKGSLFQGRKVSMAILAEFTSQLATLLEAGIPVVKALVILEGQMKPGTLKRIIKLVKDDVEGGTPFSEALEKHPGVFDNLYTNMVRAGEAGGIQETILDRLASFMEKNENIKARVKGALAYPVIVIFIAASVIMIVMTYVVPEFKKIFKTMRKGELPAITQSLIDISDGIKTYWYVWALGIPLIILIHGLLVRRIMGYRIFRDRTKLRLPLFGVLIKKTMVARFTRTFGTLISSGVPHIEALQIVRASIKNMVLDQAVDGILVSIREGEGIAVPMGKSGIFDDMIVNMVDVGEQTGELDRMLSRIADRYEIEVDRTIDVVFKLIEPIILVFLAVVVGYIVFALLSPMLKLMETI